MTIKEIEEKSGISKANIRFYEREGLLAPRRSNNNYREYTEEDVKTLSKVKFLRLIGLSISEIKMVIDNCKPMSMILTDRQKNIQGELENLLLAQTICAELLKQNCSFKTLDPSLLQTNSSNLKGGDLIMKHDKTSKTRTLETWMLHVTQGLILTIPLMIVVPKALNLSIPVWVTVFYLILTLGATLFYAILRNLPD